MQDKPLLISSLLEHAERYSAGVEVVSRRVEGDIHRYTWADVAQRSRQVAMVLDDWDLPAGSRVASIAWNGYRHLELYYGISGSQRVLHTINPRLHASQVAWMLEHAEDEVVFFDASFIDLVRTLQPLVRRVRHWVLLGDQAALERLEDMPEVVSYESLLAKHSGQYAWPQFDELAASSLCYTSGTTGNPKGALYSHRSTVLHSMILSTPSALGIGPQDVVMPVVPMFHVNGWGTPYCTAMAGCKLVLPGPALDGQSVYELIEQESVTAGAGRANGLADAARSRRCPAGELFLIEKNHHRWSGLFSEHAEALRGPLRRRSDSRLGHDRNVASGHGLRADGGALESEP